MKDQKTAAAQKILPELQSRIKQDLLKFEELRGFL